MVSDPLADPAEAQRQYGIDLVSLGDFSPLDGLILAVPDQVLAEKGWDELYSPQAGSLSTSSR